MDLLFLWLTVAGLIGLSWVFWMWIRRLEKRLAQVEQRTPEAATTDFTQRLRRVLTDLRDALDEALRDEEEHDS